MLGKGLVQSLDLLKKVGALDEEMVYWLVDW